jgi:hypothetical protein
MDKITKKNGTDSAAINLTKNPAVEQEVDVLYQRIGDKWYAFSVVEDEVFMGEVPEEAIHSAKAGDKPFDRN